MVRTPTVVDKDGQNIHSMVLPSLPCRNLPPMKIPVCTQTFPLQTGVSKVCSKWSALIVVLYRIGWIGMDREGNLGSSGYRGDSAVMRGLARSPVPQTTRTAKDMQRTRPRYAGYTSSSRFYVKGSRHSRSGHWCYSPKRAINDRLYTVHVPIIHVQGAGCGGV